MARRAKRRNRGVRRSREGRRQTGQRGRVKKSEVGGGGDEGHKMVRGRRRSERG